MEKETVSLKVDENAVQPIIRRAIQTAIIDNLDKQDDLIEKMVNIALHQKVTDKGTVAKDSYYNKYDFLEAVTNNAIQDAAREALEEWLEIKKEQLKKALLTELKKPSRQKTLAKAFADAAEKSFRSSWNFHCKVEFNPKVD